MLIYMYNCTYTNTHTHLHLHTHTHTHTHTHEVVVSRRHLLLNPKQVSVKHQTLKKHFDTRGGRKWTRVMLLTILFVVTASDNSMQVQRLTVNQKSIHK